MFETPTIDIQEIRSTLTEAGNTAAGFAVLAAKRANDFRLDAASRYSTQIDEFRKQALGVVNRVESVRADVEAAVEPVVAKVIDRLPAPAAKMAAQTQDAVKSFQLKAHDLLVDALTVDAPVAAKTARTPGATAAKTAAKTTAKTTAKPFAKTTRVAKTVKSVKSAKEAKATAKIATRKVARPAKASV